jgi:hypothetical protein
MSFSEHEGSITDFTYNDEVKMLLSVANDGMLGVFDLRKSKLYAMSDCFEEDLNAVSLMKDRKKVVAAAADGVINIFSWDWFGDCNDRITGHPNSIECMVKYDENTLITGGEDGLIRAVSVLPNRILAILGDPLDTEDEIFNIHKVTLSHCKTFVASCALDDMVKIFDVSSLRDRPADGTFDLEAYERSIADKLVPNHAKLPFEQPEEDAGNMEMDAGENKGEDSNEWSDENDSNDEDDDDDSDSDSDESDMDDGKIHKPKNKKLNPRGNTVGLSKKMLAVEKAKDFFKNL